jgi:hypothetical protein
MIDTIEGDAATEVAKVRAEMTTELTTLEANLLAEVAKVRTEMDSPAGYILLGVLVFGIGVATGHAL